MGDLTICEVCGAEMNGVCVCGNVRDEGAEGDYYKETAPDCQHDDPTYRSGDYGDISESRALDRWADR